MPITLFASICALLVAVCYCTTCQSSGSSENCGSQTVVDAAAVGCPDGNCPSHGQALLQSGTKKIKASLVRTSKSANVPLGTELQIYTQSGNTKYYLKVCGDNQATSQTSVGGWCEQFFLDSQSDGSYGIYTQSGNTKYYLKVCGDNDATSQTSVGGWCEQFHVESSNDPFVKVGEGHCVDENGAQYDTFEKSGAESVADCMSACLQFNADQCRGFTHYSNRCELRMEEGFTVASNGWSHAYGGGSGSGPITGTNGQTGTWCWRRMATAPPAPSPPSPPQPSFMWRLGESFKDCDDTCEAHGEICEESSPWPTTEQEFRKILQATGAKCDEVKEAHAVFKEYDIPTSYTWKKYSWNGWADFTECMWKYPGGKPRCAFNYNAYGDKKRHRFCPCTIAVPAPAPKTRPQCTDFVPSGQSKWTSSDGLSCASFWDPLPHASGGSTTDWNCQNWKSGGYGKTGREACCHCGGGNKAYPACTDKVVPSGKTWTDSQGR